MIQAVHPDYVSTGNEINGGMLWETGRLGNDSNFFLLLERATDAVRQTDTSTKIIIHYAGIEGAGWFFDQLDNHGIDYDMIGLSYYPYWHGKDLDSLAGGIVDLSQAYVKPVLVAETAYPFTLGWNDWTHNNIGLEEQLVPGFPATEQGQRDFMLALRNTIESANGSGFCYWGGEWVAFKGPQAADGSSWENQALFGFDNRALPVMEVFRK